MRTMLIMVSAISVAMTTDKAVGAEEYPLRDAVECHERTGLPNVYAKLAAGQTVRIGYLGGSITAQNGWRPKTRTWFQEQFPKAKVEEINAAIGGTGSDLGVYRVGYDVLRHKPDLLFVEFAVNDSGAAPDRIHKAMEGIVRQTWKADPVTDICFVYTLTASLLNDPRAGKLPRAASAMEVLADHYGIPTIYMGLEVVRLEKEGKLVMTGQKPKTPEEKAALGDKVVFSPDGVHPYEDTGHQLYLEAVVRAMGKIRGVGNPGPHRLSEPMVADNWEAAKMIPFSQVKKSAGWQLLDPATDKIAGSFRNRFPETWKASAPGESITFTFKGTAAGLYDILGPDCGQVIVTVDSNPPRTVARFDAYCNYHRISKLTVADALPDGVHTVRVEIHPEQPDKAKILSQRKLTIDDPKRFDGTAWYVGGLFLIGDLQP